MTHIRYSGVQYHLPATSGTYLCDAIRTALTEGLSFFVELGKSNEYPDLMQAIWVHPGASIEVARLDLPEDTYRHDIRDALLELARSPVKAMFLIPHEQSVEEVERLMDDMRTQLAPITAPSADEGD